MAKRKRTRKSKIDEFFEKLDIDQKEQIPSSIGYCRNRQGLFHEKFPKRHVALIKEIKENETVYYAVRLN